MLSSSFAAPPPVGFDDGGGRRPARGAAQSEIKDTKFP